MPEQPVVIAHISDIHAGSSYFIPNLLGRTIDELNELQPDVVIVSGDLTDMGFRQEFKTVRMFMDRLACEQRVIIPGNHDSKNVGHVHFEEMFGARNNELFLPGVNIVGLDSSEPDLDNGRIGRERYRMIEERFGETEGFNIVVLHHHLIPVPGTGRERNVCYDAGDVLEALQRSNIDIVLCGHKHVPYVWRLEDMMIVTGGTVSCMRLRGRSKPCYNLLFLDKGRGRIYRKYPYGGQELIVEFGLSDRRVCDVEERQ
ncbi:MAG: metallophosphoesterase [Actinobacteria bacterium]|nr:MAG: metallophosphoesterase [Actinomycetota bacterium]